MMQKLGLNISSFRIFLPRLPKRNTCRYENSRSANALRSLHNRITLVFKLPTTQAGLEATNKLLEQTIHVVDILAKQKFRGEVSCPLA